ncbi:MAG: hypothetical protein ACLU6Y_15905 [Ruminococcus sp.]
MILDLVFIINFKMGVAGAASATILSQGISAILCLVYIYTKMPALAPNRHHWKLHSKESRHQLAMGIPMALQFAITASGTMVMQSAINLFGSTAVAAFTAANKVQNLGYTGNDRHGTKPWPPTAARTSARVISPVSARV